MNNWSFVKNNKTIIGDKETNYYEIDLEKLSVNQWLKQISEKQFATRKMLMDLFYFFVDLEKLYPKLTIYKEELWKEVSYIYLTKNLLIGKE